MKTKEVFKELQEHIPFTATATIIAIIFVLIFNQINAQTSFEILHPLHILASAIVTSAIYSKYRTNKTYSILIGITGAILIGSLSDVVFPYLSSLILNLNPEFHLPLFHKPILILSTALFGAGIGTYFKITKFPHFIHVGLSVFASLFYLIAFNQNFELTYFLIASIIVFISVIIPCCISDIIYPMIFVKKK